jgi:predicted deacylase
MIPFPSHREFFVARQWFLGLLILLLGTTSAAAASFSYDRALDSAGPRRLVVVAADGDDALLGRLAAEGWPVVGRDHGGLLVETSDAHIERLRRAGLRVQVRDEDPRRTTAALQKSGAYHDYESLTTALRARAAAFPHIVGVEALGESLEGRPILAFRVTAAPAEAHPLRPPVRITGLHHGNELTSGEIVLGVLERLTEDYGADPLVTALVEELDIWLVPIVNPDGYVANARVNAAGVDLNRNYGFMWRSAGALDAPFSEPETRAVVSQFFDRPFVLQLDFHTVARFVNHLWDHSPHPTPDDALVLAWSRAYGRLTRYPVIRGHSWYEVRGSAQDASYGLFGSLGWTIETPQPAAGPAAAVAANVPAVLELFSLARYGLQGTVSDGETGAPLAARVALAGRDVSVFAAPATGAFHRPKSPGRYDLVVSAPDFAEQVVLDVTVADDGRAPALPVALARAANGFAHRLISVVSGEAPRRYDNRVAPNAVLGAPDGHGYPLGIGALVLDFGRPVPPSEDRAISVILAADSQRRYGVEVGATPWGPFEPVGEAVGASVVPLAATSVAAEPVQFVRIVDFLDEFGGTDDLGMVIDAVHLGAPEPAPAVVDVALVELTGDGDGQVQAGEEGALVLTLGNLGRARLDDLAVEVFAAASFGGFAPHLVEPFALAPGAQVVTDALPFRVADNDAGAPHTVVVAFRQHGYLLREQPIFLAFEGGEAPVIVEPVVEAPVIAEAVIAEAVVEAPVVVEAVTVEPVVAEPVVAEPYPPHPRDVRQDLGSPPQEIWGPADTGLADGRAPHDADGTEDVRDRRGGDGCAPTAGPLGLGWAIFGLMALGWQRRRLTRRRRG